ncbi:MAG: hypothetical protein ACPGC8_03220 [Flavobacteriaceae bacterium]
MSSRKHLKKEINDTLGALIEEVYVKELSSPKLDTKKSEKIIDEAISLFDDLIQQMHNDSGDSAKKHFNAIRSSLQEKASAISVKIEKL